MKIHGKTAALSALSGVAVTVAIAACSAFAGGNPANDLTNIPVKYPDWIRVVLNVDQQPTITLMCSAGTGIMTTSRDNSSAAARLDPALDKWCATQVGSLFSQTGHYADMKQPTAADMVP